MARRQRVDRSGSEASLARNRNGRGGIIMRKPLVMSLVVLVVVGVAAHVGSPYWTLHEMRSAAASGQGERVAGYVDFPALRESIKVQLAQTFASRLESRSKDAPSPIGQALAGQMVNGLVDAMITPESVAAMIRSGKAPRSIAGTKLGSNAPGTSERKEPKVRHSFEGLNTF